MPACKNDSREKARSRKSRLHVVQEGEGEYVRVGRKQANEGVTTNMKVDRLVEIVPC